MARKLTLAPIVPCHDPAMLRMSGAELKAAVAKGGAVSKRAKAELDRRAANKAAKKANAAKLAA
jgi:hypothetical protein